MGSVALVTCAQLPGGDEDADELSAALIRQDVKAEWVVWDDPEVSWHHDLVIVRSTWDYTPRRTEFLTWTRSIARLANPAPVLAWNSDKTYLRDLAAAGVPIVATEFVEPGQALRTPAVGDYVVKPSVGAGSLGAGRFSQGETGAASAHLELLHAAGRTALVQPYLSGIDADGERALIYLGGQFSHAVTKAAMLPAGAVHDVHADASHELFVEERITAATATPDERALADRAMAEVLRRYGARMLYARVDLLPGSAGPAVLELELIEPSLFLSHGSGSADRFAELIATTVAALAGQRP
jgi:glutathione synthase/RimK-type ligase-like ATP-grasp enzyme